jgi:hypothetical protein
MLKPSMSYRCSSNYERAVGNRLGDRIELLSGVKQWCGRHCRDCFPESHLVRINDTQNLVTEILHGTRRCSDIKRVTRSHQNDDKVQSNRSGCSRAILAHKG